jgi:hypothetical protein
MKSAKQIIYELVEAYEEIVGPKSCDCRPEPENQGYCCIICEAKAFLGTETKPLSCRICGEKAVPFSTHCARHQYLVSVLMLLLICCGCQTESKRNETLEDGSYISFRIQEHKPDWVRHHCPLDLCAATVRVHDDVWYHGFKMSAAIEKECQ